MDKMVQLKRQLKKIVRRYKYFTYIVIGIIGSILIAISRRFFSAEEGNILYDILMGIGCSVIATAAVTITLLLVLPDDSEENEELREWGIVKIHEERRNAAILSNMLPRYKLDYIAFGLSHFLRTHKNGEQILKHLKKGLHVRIITLHPNSEYVSKQEKFENGSGLKEEIEALGQWVAEIKKMMIPGSKGSIEIKYYDSIPLHFYCRADAKIWVGPYLPGTSSSKAITYEFIEDSKGGKYYEDLFQNYWEQKSDIHIVSRERRFLYGDQKKSIESVLKYFCDEMKKEDGLPVIGVVVLFKQDEKLRRTFFSCNKPNEEHHNCYRISEGAVGKLCTFNKSPNRAMFFRDYRNDVSIVFNDHGRKSHVKRLDLALFPFRQGTDMSAILAAPIHRDAEMIGAVTFDFSKLSSKYTATVDELKAVPHEGEVHEGHILHEWFRMADTCAKIVASMLGDEITTEFKELYEEEWQVNVP